MPKQLKNILRDPIPSRKVGSLTAVTGKIQDKSNKNEVRPSNGRQLYRHNSTGHPITIGKTGGRFNQKVDKKKVKDVDSSNKYANNQNKPNCMQIKSRKKSNEMRLAGSKKEITVVTINANGRGALGLTPRYKLDLIKSYLLSSKPDTIFFQV